MGDLSYYDKDLTGFVGGFSSGRFGYLVPFTNAPFTNTHERNYRGQRTFGKVVRFDLVDFNLSKVKVYNFATMQRQMLPPTPDHNLRGFAGGFAAGGFGYFIPQFNVDFFGKVVRLDLETEEIQFVDMTQNPLGCQVILAVLRIVTEKCAITAS